MTDLDTRSRAIDRGALSALINGAVDEILNDEEVACNERVADALNLVVNLVLERFDDPDASLAEAIDRAYHTEPVDDETENGRDETPQEKADRVLGWLK
jgi:hypothetical protein